MKVIYKYPIEITGIQTIPLPKAAKILSAFMQDETLTLWAELDNNEDLPTLRTIEVFGTGQPFEEANRQFIATVSMQNGTLIWHIYERFDTTNEETEINTQSR